jgi:uncharacterized protein (DUF2141 family)
MISFLIASLVYLPTLVWAQSDVFKIAGEIRFQRAGDLVVELLTKEELDRDVESEWQHEATFRLMIKMNEEEQAQKKASFKFENVPPGTYGLLVLQDVNGNGKFDMGQSGPMEPWGNYRYHRPLAGPPPFKEFAFEVNQDLTDIQVEIPEGFTVAGEITFQKTGSLFIQLITERQFNGQEETPFEFIIELTPEDLEKKKAPFAFYNVPSGRYGIRCFQDVNGNEELDSGLFGMPKEPWGFYRPKRPRFRGPKFEEVAFEVNADITDIQVDVK